MTPTLGFPCLALITDRTLCRDQADLEQRVAAAVKGGVGVVQLREKDLPAAELLQMARRLRAVTAGKALLIVNDRLDVALASGADGVHLPETGLPVPEARQLSQGRLLVGRSAHGVAASLESQAQGVDLLQVGTVFDTPSKAGKTLEGLALLEEVARQVTVPFVGVGGITFHNVAQVMQAGASGVAVVRAILATDDPEMAVQELWAAMEAAWRGQQASAVSG